MATSAAKKTPETVGERVQRLRKARGLTQEELGEAIQVTKGQVSRIESGDTSLTLARLPLLAKALGVKQSELLES